LRESDRLYEKIHRATAHCRCDSVEVIECRHQNDIDRRPTLPNQLEHFKPGHRRHSDVAENQLGGELVEERKRSWTVIRDCDYCTLLGQSLRERREDAFVVVNHQDTLIHRCESELYRSSESTANTRSSPARSADYVPSLPRSVSLDSLEFSA
jgi:hypothetical protein